MCKINVSSFSQDNLLQRYNIMAQLGGRRRFSSTFNEFSLTVHSHNTNPSDHNIYYRNELQMHLHLNNVTIIMSLLKF